MTITTLGITRTDGPGGRHYQVEGYDEPFPSVTTVLNVIAKPTLVPWARNVALEKVRDTLYEHLASGDLVEVSVVEWSVGTVKYLRQSGVLPQLQRALSSIPFSYSNEDSTSPDYEGLCQGRVKGGVLCNTTLQEQLM